MQADSSHSENTYFLDAESEAEMARLMHFDYLLTAGMGPLLPESIDASGVSAILDIGCGPGGWALNVAFEYPDMQVMGIDISHTMIDYARARAQSQGLENADFQVMNALEPLKFPDNAFDLVNARFIVGFMPKNAWPMVLQECLRITRPGGVIRLTECESPTTSSPACEQLNAMGTRAMWKAGQGFSSDGQHVGIAMMLGRFLKEAGCQRIEHVAHVLDCSAGTQANSTFYKNFMAAYQLAQPFLIKMEVTTQEEVNRLYLQALTEMLSDDFCAVWFYLSVLGEKP